MINSNYNINSTFHLILPNSLPDSWGVAVWGDLEPYATIHLNNSTVKIPWLQKLKKIHFSNSANKKVCVGAVQGYLE